MAGRLDDLRTLRVANLDAAFATGFVTLNTGAFLVGFIQLLGGGDLWIGLLGALPSLLGIVQIPAAAWGRAFPSYKRFVMPPGVIWRALYVPIALLPLLPWPNELRLTLLAALVGLASLSITLAQPTYNEWLAEMVPGEARGWFFARRNAIATGVAAVVGIAGAALLDHFRGVGREAQGFAVVFGIGLVCALVSEVFFLMMKDRPRREVVRENLRETLTAIRRPLGDAGFRRVLTFLAVGVASQTMGGNLFVAFGRETLGLDFKVLQGLGVSMAVGNLAAASLWGFLADKYGNRTILMIAVAGVALNPVAWMLCRPNADAFNSVLLLSSHVYMGVAWAGVALCQFNLLLATAKPAERAAYLGAGMTVIAVTGGVAPFVGGLLMSGLRAGLGAEDAYKVIFGLSIAMRFGSLFFLARVDEPGAAPLRETLRDLRSLHPRGVRQLRKIAQADEPEARVAAIEGAAEDRNALAANDLLRETDDAEPSVRLSALVALARLGDPRAAEAIRREIERSPSLAEPRLVALLGRTGDPAAVPTLAGLLDHPRPVIRRSAAAGIGNVCAAAGVPAPPELVSAAGRGDDADLRAGAILALHQAGVPGFETIAEAGLLDPAPWVREAAARALRERRACAPLLRKAATRADDPARGEIARALGACGDPADVPLLLSLATEAGTDGERRRALLGAAEILGVERETYRLFRLSGFARDRAMLEMVRSRRKDPRLQGALRAFVEGEEARALAMLAESDPVLAPLAATPAPEAFLVAWSRASRRSGA